MYVLTISYNFDTDYIARRYSTYKEALIALKDYLLEEIKIVRNECEYEPSVLKWAEDDITLVYAEAYTIEEKNREYAKEDCAFYRIFSIEN